MDSHGWIVGWSSSNLFLEAGRYSIRTDSRRSPQITGKGLALAGVAMEQDTAYWEAHIAISAEDARYRVWFGVASKKTREFYKEKEQGGALETEVLRAVCDDALGRDSSHLVPSCPSVFV